MRSSKTRSRSKNNRNRSMGNIVNRVFDSSGPEGTVRCTPQQIKDIYTQLARDAQLSGDRVAAENFQQHSEHYTRMLSEAQREQDARREQQEREQEARREQQERERAERQQQNHDRQERRSDGDKPEPGSGPGEVVEMSGGDSDSTLVETPESKPSRPRRQRRPRNSEPAADTGGDTPETPEAAE